MLYLLMGAIFAWVSEGDYKEIGAKILVLTFLTLFWLPYFLILFWAKIVRWVYRP